MINFLIRAPNRLFTTFRHLITLIASNPDYHSNPSDRWSRIESPVSIKIDSASLN